MDKKPRPLYACTVCGGCHSTHVLNNRRCLAIRDGEQCQGVVRISWDIKDWQECPSCNGTGEISDSLCRQCCGIGWLFKTQLEKPEEPSVQS